MQMKILMFLVVVSLGLGGFATWKHFEKGPEEMAQFVMEGVDKLRAKEVTAEKKRRADLLKQKAKELSSDQSAPMTGNLEGDISIVYFFDYACGYCRKADPIIDELVKTDPNLKIVYREFPIFSDTLIARSALAAHKQGRYLAMHRELMANEREFTKATVLAIAKKVGLQMLEFEKDMNDPSLEAVIQQNHQIGESIGVEGTPVFVIGDATMLPGIVSIDEFRLVIQKEREKLAGAAQKESPHNGSSGKS